MSALEQLWLSYFERAMAQHPSLPFARDAMNSDLCSVLGRLIPADGSVLEVGCGRGDLLATLPNTVRAGIDFRAEAIDAAKVAHPDISFSKENILEPAEDQKKYDSIICDRLGHSVSDVRLLLERLSARLNRGGRIFLITFNGLWEAPTRLAETAGLKIPSPTSNWLSETDFINLFSLTGLESVRHEDRMMLPVDVPGLSSLANRYAVKLPAVNRAALYRVYVLRRKDETPYDVRNPSVSVIVPARNEAGNILAAVERTPVMGSSTELIFVEGHSKDDTWARIQEVVANYKGPLKLSAVQQTGKGKGDAVRAGFAMATGDILMILDADLTVPPEDLPVFQQALADGHADYVQGTRLVYPMDPGAMRFFNKLGNIGFSMLFTHLLQQPIKDTLCGTKVLWRRDYERLAAARSYFGDFDPFGDFDLIFGAARLNLKIGEIPVRYRERTYGETNIERWKHGVLLLKMSAVAARKLRYV